MADGIDDQVHEHAAQERSGRRRPAAGRGGRPFEPLAGLLRDGCVLRHDLVGQLGERHRLAHDRHLPFLDLADLEQVLDEPHHLATGPVDLQEVAAVRFGEVGTLPQRELDQHRDAVHGVLEVVDDHVGEVVLQPLDLGMCAQRLLGHLRRARELGRDLALTKPP